MEDLEAEIIDEEYLFATDELTEREKKDLEYKRTLRDLAKDYKKAGVKEQEERKNRYYIPEEKRNKVGVKSRILTYWRDSLLWYSVHKLSSIFSHFYVDQEVPQRDLELEETTMELGGEQGRWEEERLKTASLSFGAKKEREQGMKYEREKYQLVLEEDEMIDFVSTAITMKGTRTVKVVFKSGLWLFWIAVCFRFRKQGWKFLCTECILKALLSSDGVCMAPLFLDWECKPKKKKKSHAFT